MSKNRTKPITFKFAFKNSSVRLESEICRWPSDRERTFCKLRWLETKIKTRDESNKSRLHESTGK